MSNHDPKPNRRLTDEDRQILARPEGLTLGELAKHNIARKRAGLPLEFPVGWRTAKELPVLPSESESWPDEAA